MTARLGDHLLRVTKPGPNRSHSTFRYIDLSSIDASAKRITSASQLPVSGAPSRARQLVTSGDVLVSTVRPNLNGVAFVPDEEAGSIASTGFAVLRPASTLDGRYLFHWVRSKQFIDDMVRKATGASYPAVSETIVRSSEIPLPPLPEQRRIAAILDQADALRQRSEWALAALDEYEDSAFRDSFADLGEMPMTEFRNLVADTKLGLVRSSKETGIGLGPLYIRMNAITTDGKLEHASALTTVADEREQLVFGLQRGDFLFNTRNTRELVGKAAVVRDLPEAVFNNNILRVRFNELAMAEYVSRVFRTDVVRKQLDSRKAGTTSVFAVYARDLNTIRLPMPSLERQREYEELVGQIEQERRVVRERSSALDTLFASLQSRAFRGEL